MLGLAQCHDSSLFHFEAGLQSSALNLTYIQKLALQLQLFLLEAVVADVVLGDLMDLLQLLLVLLEFLVGFLLLFHPLNGVDVLFRFLDNTCVTLALEFQGPRAQLSAFALGHA